MMDTEPTGVTNLNREALTPATSVLARKMLGWTQAALALRSGVAPDTVANFESGRRLPRYETVTALLRAFRDAGIVFVLREGEARYLSLQSPAAPDLQCDARYSSG
jgi:transcriptional regulator with XRE-family HTH domain